MCPPPPSPPKSPPKTVCSWGIRIGKPRPENRPAAGLIFAASTKQNSCKCDIRCYNIRDKVEAQRQVASKLNQGLKMILESENFSERLKRVRSQLSLSQEDLAHSIGVSFATVNRWENGKASPSKLARKSFDNFCALMKKQGKLETE